MRMPWLFHGNLTIESAFHEVPGAFMSYGNDRGIQFRRAATCVDRILRNSNPGDSPVEQSMKCELIINCNTAKAHGAANPQLRLIGADKVIE
jgi:putative ABC transport system substrate-binding protein